MAAFLDPLTGLPNRRYLEEKTAQIWKRSDDEVSPTAVVMIDIDHFKKYNDRHGHPAGDLCLKRVAGAVSGQLRGEADIAIRLGGEEFLLLLPQTELGEAIRIAERIRRAIESLAIPHEGLTAGCCVTASFGVMAGHVSAHPLGELLAGADTALYAAKRNGRNQVWPPLLARTSTVAVLEPRSARRAEGDRHAS
jgi:diguanylate cyclase (GGDEF)-like protein